MAPSYPSPEELHTRSALLQQEVERENEAAWQLYRRYFDTKSEKPQAVEDLWWALAYAADAHAERQHQLLAALAAYGDATDPCNAVEALQLTLLPDLTPPSGDQVLLAAAAIRRWRALALRTPLVQYVLTFLEIMSEDVRLNLTLKHRTAARDLHDQVLAGLYPPLTTGLFSTQNLSSSIFWLLDLLHQYTHTRATLKPLLATTANRTTLLHVLHETYPELSLCTLRACVQKANPRSERHPRPAALAEALMTERYGLTSRSSVRKALTRAAKAQALQGALAELTQGLVSYLCVLLTPRHVLHTAALLLPPAEKSGNSDIAVFA